MTNRVKLFIKKQVTHQKLCDNYWYSYLEEGTSKVLRVYKGKQQLYERKAKIGDAFEVIIKQCVQKEKVFVSPMQPPRKDWEVIAWLRGFGRNERVSTYEEYVSLLETRKEACQKPGYVESTTEGPNFAFTECSFVNGKRQEYKFLACWVDEAITKAEICHLIPEYVYPEQYVRKVLAERFGITAKEFDEALSSAFDGED
jgi:hypothetical protein